MLMIHLPIYNGLFMLELHIENMNIMFPTK